MFAIRRTGLFVTDVIDFDEEGMMGKARDTKKEQKKTPKKTTKDKKKEKQEKRKNKESDE